MKYQEKKYDIGVVVGRFQIAELHEAHRKLINFVFERHKRVIIFLGVSPTLGTKNNPLDFTSRAGLFDGYRGKYATRLVIHPLKDYPGNDEMWSKNLDSLIVTIIPKGSVCLYGGRDSFISCYSGIHDTYELGIISDVEGKTLRSESGKTLINSVDFRAGQIYQSQNRFPAVFPTVDMAVVKREGDRHFVLMGLKADHKGLSFPGGFVDPTDVSYEDAARRELSEEIDVEVGESTKYVGSFRIADPRYTGEEKIITSLYCFDYVYGTGSAKDEFVHTVWVSLENAMEEEIASTHRILYNALKSFLKIGGRANGKKSVTAF